MERTTVLPEIRKMRFEEEWEPTPYAFFDRPIPDRLSTPCCQSPLSPEFSPKLKDPGIIPNQATSPGSSSGA